MTLFALMILCCVILVASYPVPSPMQLAWSRMEIGTMISFGMETSAYNVSDIGFCGFQTGNYFPSPDLFNPMFLDTNQWAQAMVSYGSQYAVFTAKHCSGFALWPTEVAGYNYSVKNTAWLDGKGDVVSMFIDSCKEYGIRPGLYYSVGNNFYLNIHNGQVQSTKNLLPGQRNITIEEYEAIVVAQLTEIWTKYGQLAEIWFDGGAYSFSGTLANLLEKLQPNAIAFQGPVGYANNIRWVGNEMADPPYPCWSTANNADDYGGGNTSPSAVWVPAESDTTIRNGDKWFWTDDYFQLGIKSSTTLFSLYEATVGRNTNFLLNLSPDPYGMVPIEDFIEYGQLGKMIITCYGTSFNHTQGTGNTITLGLSNGHSFNRIVISENQQFGQRVRNYTLAVSTGGAYTQISKGTSIGNKKIDTFSQPIQATSVQLTITGSIDTPIISTLAAYMCDI